LYLSPCEIKHIEIIKKFKILLLTFVAAGKGEGREKGGDRITKGKEAFKK